MAEVVHDGVTGFVCEKPDELADAIGRVDRLDPAACRRHVAEHFTADKLGAGYEAAYQTARVRIRGLVRRSTDELAAAGRDPLCGSGSSTTAGDSPHDERTTEVMRAG